MSTTTHLDRQAVKYLAPLAGEDPEKLGIALLERGMDLSGMSLDILLARDTKMFTLSEKTVQIAQVMVPTFSWNRERDAAIKAELEKSRAGANADLSLALFTNVLENSSDLYGAGDAVLLGDLFGGVLPARLSGVMSRKKDFLPWLGEKLRKQGRV
jgi:manganese-dependent inorganic pyrophosphatase